MNLELLADDGTVAKVGLAGEISQIRFRGGGNPLEELLGSGCYGRTVLLDGAGGEWIDSSGISWLIASHKRFRDGGGRLVLFGLTPRVRGVLQFCRVDSILNVADDEAAARAVAGRAP